VIDAKRLFDQIRAIKGSPLTQDEVDAVNATVAQMQAPAGTAAPHAAMDVTAFAMDEVRRWEGGYSINPNDAGNWYDPVTGKQAKGVGALFGSCCGVTAKTLTIYLGRAVTVQDVKAVTVAQAADISKRLFYSTTGLQNLPWNAVTASLLDFCWGAGPVGGIKAMQDLLDVGQDGLISTGGDTVKAFSAWVGHYGLAALAGAWWGKREEYYEALVLRRPSDEQFIHGWDNRSAYFLPGHSEGWWNRFNGGAA
jgi:lysozyme family protein